VGPVFQSSEVAKKAVARAAAVFNVRNYERAASCQICYSEVEEELSSESTCRRAENTGQRQAAEIVVYGRRPTTGSGQRNRHQGITRSRGTLAPTTVSGRTGSNRNNQDVAAGRASSMVDDEAQFTEFDGILAPGLVNVADMGESGDARGAVALTTDQRGRAGRGEGHSQLPSPHPYERGDSAPAAPRYSCLRRSTCAPYQNLGSAAEQIVLSC